MTFTDPTGQMIPLAVGVVIAEVAEAAPIVAETLLVAYRTLRLAERVAKLTQADKEGQICPFAKEVKDQRSVLSQENPRNLIPTETKSDLTKSRVSQLSKDMKKNGFDQSKPVDVWRNPNTGRLEIQDGHHRTEAAKNAGLDKIPVLIWE